MSESGVIYDLGSNNGDDIPYYLQKSRKVVAVEANPVLIKQIEARFSEEILSGKLSVEHCVLTTENKGEMVSFYIHKHNHVLSQFPRPEESFIADFDETMIKSRNIRDIISRYGNPYYIKIDLENYDQAILMELLRHGIKPKFLSAESHSIEVFALLVSLGYASFNLVDGAMVHKNYANHFVATSSGMKLYAFPHHSAGPFGEDIKGHWMTPENFLRLLAFEGLGWKDIHATTEIDPDPSATPNIIKYSLKEIIFFFKHLLRHRAPFIYDTLRNLRIRITNLRSRAA
jgi:FkbM family methyltransferase